MKRIYIIMIALAVSIVMMAGGRRVLFIGDSITDGAWGNSKVWNTPSEERNQYDMNHIYGHGYMMIVAACCQANHPEEGWTFWNRGISGNTLNDLAGRWQKDALALQPDLVSILVGTNDVDRALGEGKTIDLAAWEKKYRELLDEVLKQNPQATFALCTPFVAKAGRVGENANYGERQKMIAQLVKVIEHISKDYPATLVPFHTLVAETIASTPNLPVTYWIWDGIHPTPAMHYKMAELWMQKIFR